MKKRRMFDKIKKVIVMDSVNKTLYIPLYGKALVSRSGILLRDPKAEEIWEAEGFPLKGKAASRWLAYYLGIRAAVFDRWVSRQRQDCPAGVVLHIGCGLDSRAQRLDAAGTHWYDIDLPPVIRQRKRFFEETEQYRMVEADIRQENWLDAVSGEETAIVVMEGVSMYLRPEELRQLLIRLKGRFPRGRLLTDCYTAFAAKASRYKNPIHAVGVTQVWGVDDPAAMAAEAGMEFLAEREMTPEELICCLPSRDRVRFRWLYAGKMAKKLCRLYEFRWETPGRSK